MALIDCKECGNQVSDKASACPKCGAPVSASTIHQTNPRTAARFKDPRTGQVVDVANAWVFALLFGCIYFLFRGIYRHALISLVLALVTYGVAWLIYPIFAQGIVRKDVIAKGWIAIE